MNAAAPTAKTIMHIIAVVFHVKPLENIFQTEEAESCLLISSRFFF